MRRNINLDPSAHHVVWVLDKKSLQHLVKYAIPSSDVVVFDLETTGLDEHAVSNGDSNGGVAARVVLAALTLDHDDRLTSYVVPLSHPQSTFLGQWQRVTRLLAQTMRGKRLVGHNVKFDCRWIHALTGVDLSRDVFWDTMISAHLLDENSSSRLKEVAPKIFGVERWDDFNLSKPGAAEMVDLFKLGDYGADDTYWTARVLHHHYDHMIGTWIEQGPITPDEVLDARLGEVMINVSMPTARTLTAIEQRGLILDTDWVTEERDRLQDAHRALFSELASVYAGERVPGDPDAILDVTDASFAPTSIWFRNWADIAVEKGDLTVASLTPTGKPQWSKSVLQRQARKGSEIAQKLLDLRDSAKRAEFLTSWLDKVSADGRIYATYNIGSVTTGRLSSSEPNMQQVTYSLKPAFRPSQGYYLAELDFSQIELRVAAFISRCEPMIEAFQRGDDLHTMLASRITGKSTADITKADRQAGKSANFGLLYGMGARGFREYAEDAYGVILTEEEAEHVHQAFFDLWKGLREWHIKTARYLDRNGYVVSPIGRVRRLDDIRRMDEGRAIRAAINSPVQGFASDIMQIAASIIEGVHPAIEPLDTHAKLVGTVHDSILVEVPVDSWEADVKVCKEAMESGVMEVLGALGCHFDIPLVADATVGTAWGLTDVLGE